MGIRFRFAIGRTISDRFRNFKQIRASIGSKSRLAPVGHGSE